MYCKCFFCWAGVPYFMRVGPSIDRPPRFTNSGDSARAISWYRMICSVSGAPRPPHSLGQFIPTYPASHIRFCQARSRRTSSTSARDDANALPRSSSGTLASSHARTSFRNASSLSLNSKSIATSSPHHASTIHHQRLACDVAGLVGGQEHRGVADVLRRLLALHGDDVGHALLEDLARG